MSGHHGQPGLPGNMPGKGNQMIPVSEAGLVTLHGVKCVLLFLRYTLCPIQCADLEQVLIPELIALLESLPQHPPDSPWRLSESVPGCEGNPFPDHHYTATHETSVCSHAKTCPAMPSASIVKPDSREAVPPNRTVVLGYTPFRPEGCGAWGKIARETRFARWKGNPVGTSGNDQVCTSWRSMSNGRGQLDWAHP